VHRVPVHIAGEELVGALAVQERVDAPRTGPLEHQRLRDDARRSEGLVEAIEHLLRLGAKVIDIRRDALHPAVQLLADAVDVDAFAQAGRVRAPPEGQARIEARPAALCQRGNGAGDAGRIDAAAQARADRAGAFGLFRHRCEEALLQELHVGSEAGRSLCGDRQFIVGTRLQGGFRRAQVDHGRVRGREGVHALEEGLAARIGLAGQHVVAHHPRVGSERHHARLHQGRDFRGEPDPAGNRCMVEGPGAEAVTRDEQPVARAVEEHARPHAAHPGERIDAPALIGAQQQLIQVGRVRVSQFRGDLGCVVDRAVHGDLRCFAACVRRADRACLAGARQPWPAATRPSRCSTEASRWVSVDARPTQARIPVIGGQYAAAGRVPPSY
jgi:hypothetical protein